MRSRASRPLVLLLTVAALAACDPGGEPGPEETGDGFQTIDDDEPAGLEDVVQHLIEAPPYPGPVTDEAELVELRSPDLTRRHHLFLAELEQDGTLDGELVRGSVVRLAEGVTLTVPDGASMATLDGSTVTDVSACEAPCEATGPALVAPPDWLPGIRVAADWELVVPAPSE